uniref:CUE domain-containing protein 1-like n=1 Tax=Ciona intestinalis TaxID=7719 RepID=UPI0002B8ED8E|nr:CUE domain-containing protein 1-like [Ciona intestinalis]|eukprot:XP_002131968.2 CUE domain-containing protein 1-like [Ciona intestinalis]
MTQSPVRARTLEYTKAMQDFKVMFPTLEPDVIECVLRSNSGHVDSTIDNLLQLTIDDGVNGKHSNRHGDSFIRRIPQPEWDDRQRSEACCPPRYTPLATPHQSQSRMYSRDSVPYHHRSSSSKSFDQPPHSTYRDWNPPLLGKLPDDFLRIVPTPVQSHRNLNRRKSEPKRKSSQKESSLNLHRSTSYTLQDQVGAATSLNNSFEARSTDDNQAIEDRRIALLLQNKEFMLELRRNEEFLKELQKCDTAESRTEPKSPRQFNPISVDPLNEVTRTHSNSKLEEFANLENPPIGEFGERSRPMSKSTKRKLSDIAQRLNLRRTSYKSLDKIDPIFANTEDGEFS